MIYFDSSALVKRYVEEEGTNKVKAIIDNSHIITTSKLTYPEILSAFSRKYKAGDISKSNFYRAMDKFESDWNYFLIVEFQDELLPIIKRIVDRYYLRGADSVHLSSALWLKQVTKENISFIASDTELLKAGKAEDLQVINPVSSIP